MLGSRLGQRGEPCRRGCHRQRGDSPQWPPEQGPRDGPGGRHVGAAALSLGPGGDLPPASVGPVRGLGRSAAASPASLPCRDADLQDHGLGPPAPRSRARGPTQRVRCPLPPSAPPGARRGSRTTCLGDAARTIASCRASSRPDAAAKSHTLIPSQALRVAGSLGQGLSGPWVGCWPAWGRRLPQTSEMPRGGGEGLRGGLGQEGCFHVAPGARPAWHRLLQAPVAVSSGRTGLCQPPLSLTLRTGEAGGGGGFSLGTTACPVRRSQWTFLPPPLHPPSRPPQASPFSSWSFPRVQGWGLGWSPPLHEVDRALS